MASSKTNRYWILITVLLIAIIITGSAAIWLKYVPGKPIEISMPPKQEVPAEIYIGGAITNPGYYPLKTGDNLEILIQAAGGTTGNADPSHLELYIPQSGERELPQRIDINRAETWLLESLPGIGSTLAQRIVDYRNQNGLFRNTNELTRVEGIGISTYEQVEPLITVGD
jgi:competence protein ComEA